MSPFTVTHGPARQQFGMVPRAFSEEFVGAHWIRSIFTGLATFADSGYTCRPGRARLMKASGIDDVATISRGIKALEVAGWIEVIRVPGKGNEYSLAPAWRRETERLLREYGDAAFPGVTNGSPVTNESPLDPRSTGDKGVTPPVTNGSPKQTNEQTTTNCITPPTPLSEGGAVEVIEGTIEDGESTTTDPLRGHRWSAKLTRRGGAPTEQEHAAAGEVFDAWVQSPEVLGRPRRSGAVLTGDRIEVIVHRLRDGYGVDDLADACRGWTRIPHNRGENERGTRYDSLAFLLRDAEHVDRFRDAWRDQHDPADGVRQAALMRQATRNPMLAAAAAAAPEGMGRDPRRDRDVLDALDDALRILREDAVRAGHRAPLRLTPEQEEEVIREALAARAVPC